MSKALATKNVAAVVLAFAMIVGIAFAFATPAKADVLSDLQAQVQALLAQISSLQGGSGAVVGASCTTFTQNLKAGSSGGEVMALQKFLNSHGAQVSASGAGSPGNETSYFGPATKAAVIKFQNAYASDILAPVGLTAGTGNWFASTRAKANLLCAGGGTTGGTTGGVVVPTGPGITVSAAAQPANSLAPKKAIRVPFTNITLTNNTGAAVTITGVTVQRTGLAADAAFASVVLIDSNGLQIGNTQTWNSNHTAIIGGTFTLAAGSSMQYTVAGNMATDETAYAGQVASIAVTGVNTSVAVNGSLPITGASQTINNSLVIGIVSNGVSAFDPNSAASKQIGSTGVKFSGVRFTADSTEDVKLYSIRWRVNGSASAGDISNVVTVISGTTYPTTISADGRYYTATFAGGLLVTKGNSIDAYVQGDLSGSNSSGRIVQFDIDKTSDVYFVGQTYGYGIKVTLAGSCTALSTASTHTTCLSDAASALQPWLQGSTVTILAGTVTMIQNASSIASQNIAVNVPNQTLGGFTTNFAGEPVTVSGMTFRIASVGTTSVNEITSVSLVDSNGAVIAGPVDAVGSVVTYSNSITFPVGASTYTLKGKIPSTGWPTNSTVVLSTTPSGWTTPTGQTSGNTVTISTAVFTMNTMTVKAGYIAISAGTSPASQNVVAGGQSILMGKVQLDTTASGEDMRMSSLGLRMSGNGAVANLSGCALFNGATQLNTGSNVVNSVTNSSYSTAYNTFTFDDAQVFPKGVVTTLSLKCNLSSTASSSQTYIWGVGADYSTTVFPATGSVSGNNVAATVSATVSGTMTVSTGGVTVTVDSSSPSYTVRSAGTTGIIAGVYKVRATNEDFNLAKVGLTLASGIYGATSTGAGGSPSSGAGDLVTAYLYNGATLLGTATFTGTSQTATSTFTSSLLIPRDTDTLITVKVDLAGIGMSSSGGIGNLVTVDSLNYEGTGVASGVTLRGNGSTGVAGFRLFKSYPTLALDTLGSTGVGDGRLMHFKVTANSAGPVSIYNMHFTFATTTATISNVQLFGFSDSAYSSPISGQGDGGQIGITYTGYFTSTADAVFTARTPVVVPAGGTYYFEVRTSITGVTSGASVITKLLGDTTYTPGFAQANSISGYNVGSSTVAATTTGNFIWSGNSTTTPATTDVDWSNGYSLPGLPSGGLIMTRGN